MTQITTTAAARRKARGGDLDVYTVLAVVGVVALIASLVIVWMAGSDRATDARESQAKMPWELIEG